MQTYQINNQEIENSNIIVNNFITISNQSILSPEIIFINRPFLVNNKGYYKMFINLNYNPNFVKKSDLKNIKSFDNLDFKLYESKTLKEIKSNTKYSKQITIDNNAENNFKEIEYNIPVEMVNNNLIYINFGNSYKENSFDFKGKGQITIDLSSNGGSELEQNIVMYLPNWNEKNQFFKSVNILKSFSKIILQPLTVNKSYEHLLEINNEFFDNIPKRILNNSRVSEIVSQVKNNTISPLFKVGEILFSDKNDFKKNYQGSLDFEFEKNNDGNFYLKSKNKWVLDESTKLIELKKSSKYETIVFNPFSWSKEQTLIFKIDLLGKKIEFEIPLNTFSKYYEWNQKFEFDFKKTSFKKLQLDKIFWNNINFLNNKELKEELKKYEV
ncbi:hypothetical protein EELLY_v1c03990 [Entomoplasma ellychniae]|uniref:Uncharacterized protein n=1 Tax=Entomoplasma ellychniae TaxID=2114 RepID=A0A8E2QYP5_9MOLU|nr:hypothetical protein [Entomoplasma ellychniae]PPE04719.1 hypothetical protein EELLY_v1c03990 [Entomoplasma ellychniae]